MHLQENGSSRSSTDELKRMIKFAKVISLSSSSLGIVMIPVLTSKLMEAAADNPGAMVLLVFANSFVGLLTFTPLLLHFLTKRFVANIYYNSKSQLFTSVHYNFLMQKQALRFRSDDVVDLAVALQKKKILFPMATCFVDSHPLLLLLDHRLYSNQDAFDLLTKNVHIPDGHD
uniref:Transmembrane protein 70 n=1 Tax=Ditylenchus dipsaci TaxID=166011 RepID=A0A915D254_9BILA